MSESKYFISHDVSVPVRVRVDGVVGKGGVDYLSQLALQGCSPTLASQTSQLYVTCRVCSDGAPIGLPVMSTYKCFQAHQRIRWHEWFEFSVKYCDLPMQASLVFTVWEVLPPLLSDRRNNNNNNNNNNKKHSGSEEEAKRDAVEKDEDEADELLKPRIRPLGGTTLPLFSKNGTMNLGTQRLLLWRDREGDPALRTTTPHVAAGKKKHGMERLDEVIREFDQKEKPFIPWLDDLALRQIQHLQQHAHRQDARTLHTVSPHLPKSTAQYHHAHHAFAQKPVLHAQYVASQFNSLAGVAQDDDDMFLTIQFPDWKYPVLYLPLELAPKPSKLRDVSDRTRLLILHDPEMNKENPAEKKYYKLAGSSMSLAARELKPNIMQREQLAKIINSPTKKLTAADKSLLMMFRFSLTQNKRALTKFLRAVDWSDAHESKEALALLREWTTIDIADALELVGKDFANNKSVRKFAVAQLRRATDDELLSYLLQLVQALRYEGYDEHPDRSPLARLLIERCSGELELCNFAFWYLGVEVHDKDKGHVFKAVQSAFLEHLGKTAEGQARKKMLDNQMHFIERLMQLSEAAAGKGGKVKEKIERMRSVLGSSAEFADLLHMSEPVHVPVRPKQLVTGMVPEKSTMFKSALAPILGTFTTPPRPDTADTDDGNRGAATAAEGGGGDEGSDGPAADASRVVWAPGTFRTIFKNGDDLRQDQLVIQMINLMDSLFKKVNLDLALTPYRVLATGPEHGFVEFVAQSHTISGVLADYGGDIRQFFAAYSPKPSAQQRMLQTFVKSLAGYCVITYVLAVGDRHLDNVMIDETGRLFHIDFGWLFYDPKPFPPPFKLCKEFVMAMGGADSKHYQDFKRYCCVAFNILRRHSSLIINLLSLMSEAGIPHLAKDVQGNLFKVEQNFRLDLSDEEAELFMLRLIDESVSALFPVIVERIHKWAVYWK